MVVGDCKPMKASHIIFDILFFFLISGSLNELNQDRSRYCHPVFIKEDGNGLFDLLMSSSGEKANPSTRINKYEGSDHFATRRLRWYSSRFFRMRLKIPEWPERTRGASFARQAGSAPRHVSWRAQCVCNRDRPDV